MLRWMDGFEHYGTTETHMTEGVGGAAAWSEVESNFVLSTTNPATGASHMRFSASNGDTQNLRRPLGQSKQICGFGYRLSLNDLPSVEDDSTTNSHLAYLSFRDVANSEQIRISAGTEGSVRAMRGSTSLGRSDPAIAAGGYHHFEAKAKIDNTTGYVEVRVNEVTVLNLTGIDTQSTANAETSQFSIVEYGDVTDAGAGFGFMDIDDVFAWDNDSSDAANTVIDFVGDKGCYYLPTTADTAEADWTKSTGVTGYSLIDELDPLDTDYIADTTGAARSIFEVAALPGNVAEVIAMQPVARARKEESGTVTLRMGVVVGASESYTVDASPSTTFAYLTPTPKTIDPDTGVAWTSTANPDLLIERTA